MKLDKLFGSKTKIDIFKYLLFRKQGISLRTLESETGRTFPAIQKQVQGLEEAWLLEVARDATAWAISLHPELVPHLRALFYFSLQQDIIELFTAQWDALVKYFWGDRFGKEIGADLVILYQQMEKSDIDQLKQSISEIFREYWIESVSVVMMSNDERERRYRLADRFALQVMRYYNTIE